MAHIEHQGAKDVPVAVDHPLTVTTQIATALQPLIQTVGHFLNQRAMFGIMQLKTFGVGDP